MIGNAGCPQFPAAQLWLLWLRAGCTMLHLDFPEVVHLVDAVEVVLHASDISDPSHWTKPLQSRCQAPSHQLR